MLRIIYSLAQFHIPVDFESSSHGTMNLKSQTNTFSPVLYCTGVIFDFLNLHSLIMCRYCCLAVVCDLHSIVCVLWP